MLTFSEFLNIFYECTDPRMHRYEYVRYMTNLFIVNGEDVDVFPDDISKNTLSKIFRGDDELPDKTAKYILDNWDENGFVDMFEDLEEPQRIKIIRRFKEQGVVFGDAEKADTLANCMKRILSIRSGIDAQKVSPLDKRGIPLKYVDPDYVMFDTTTKKFVIDDGFEIDDSLVGDGNPPANISSEELQSKYLKCLFEAYADSYNMEKISKEEVENNLWLSSDLREQRRYFYSAERLRLITREYTKQGEKSFEILKTEMYEGIRETYLSRSYPNGLERLYKVEGKATDTVLDAAEISRFKSLVTAAERKGLCHSLVEDGRIPSWVLKK